MSERCSDHWCLHRGTQRVWSPLFRNADLGPVLLCDEHASLLAPRAANQGWWTGDEADKVFAAATVITRSQVSDVYAKTLVDLFRYGLHVGGVPLGQELEDSATAVYVRKGAVWIVTNLFVIGLQGLPSARVRLKKSPGSGVTRPVSV